MRIWTIIGISLLVGSTTFCLSCGGSNVTKPLDDGNSIVQAKLSQSAIWQHPKGSLREGAFRTDPDGNQYYFGSNSIASFSVDGDLRWEYEEPDYRLQEWDICDQHIRGIHYDSIQSGSISSFYIFALGQNGTALWRTFFETNNEYIRIDDFAVSENGWTYFYYDTRNVTGVLGDEIVAVSPGGEVSWRVVPTKQHPDNNYVSSGFDSMGLRPDGTLIALDQSSVLYLYSQSGNLLVSSPSSLRRLGWGTIRESTVDGFFVTEGSEMIRELPGSYGDYYSGLPEYYSTGFFEDSAGGLGRQLMFYNYDLDEIWSVPARSLVTATAPNMQGGIIVGGYAGEVSSYNDQGEELWRVIPDQQMEAQHSLNASMSDALYGTPETTVGVSSICVSPTGEIAVSTDTGLLYLVDQAGAMQWTWHGVGGSPSNPTGYGIGSNSYSYACSGLAWDSDGNLQCSDGSTLMTIDPNTGKLLGAIFDPYMRFFEEAPDSSLRIAGGLYAASLSESGALLWETQLPDNSCSRPVVDATLNTYIPTARGGMCKLDESGNLAWEIGLPERVFCAPVMGADGNVLAVTVKGDLVSVSPTGSVLWTIEDMNERNLPPNACPEGIAVITAENSIAFVSYEGAILWDYPTDNWFLAPPITNAESTVFAGDRSGIVYAIDSAGTEVFKFENSASEISGFPMFGGQVMNPPLLMPDGSVVVEFMPYPQGGCIPYDDFGVIKCFSATGDVLWQLHDETEDTPIWYSASFSVPGLVNGEWLMTVSQDGRVLVNSVGESIPLEFPDDWAWYNVSRRMSNKAGFFTYAWGYSSPGTLYWSELRFN